VSSFLPKEPKMPTPDIMEDANAELARVYAETGIDLSVLPAAATTAQLAAAINVTEGALVQDRYRQRGIPYVQVGARRIRYLRVDVARYLLSHRKLVEA
jgi:hypothetical protein